MTAAILALPRRTFASVRKHRNYRLFFTGQVISLVGTWMQNIALAWFVIELTHSAVAVGFLAFCRFAPFTVFGLISGVIADRFDNRRLVMTTQAASMAVAAALTVLALDHGATGIYNAVDDSPAPMREWVPYLANLVGAPRPPTVSTESAERDAGHQVVYYGTQLRGASNAKVRRELGFSPLYPDWKGGFRASLSGATPARRPSVEPMAP